jgi:hypothetical protein
VLPILAAPTWSAELEPLVGGIRYRAKTELHITLLSRVQIEALAEAGLDARELDRWLARFRFRFRWTRRLWLIERGSEAGKERSIVQLIRQPDQSRLRRALKRASGVNLGEPVPHVTLYTAGCPEGIGIPNREAFRRLRTAALSLAALTDPTHPARKRCPRRAR